MLELRFLPRKSHSIWLMALLDPTLERFRKTRFSFFDLRWMAAKSVVRLLPEILESYSLGERTEKTLQKARALDSVCYGETHDFTPGAYREDCLAICSMAIQFQHLLETDYPGEFIDFSIEEEEHRLAEELSRYAAPGYLRFLDQIVVQLTSREASFQITCEWVSSQLSNPDFRRISHRIGKTSFLCGSE